MAGISAERQESAFVKKIRDVIKLNQNNPITIIAGKTKIVGVTGADKFKDRQLSGSEPYTDVQIFTRNKIINCSLKGESAPSLAGGGMRGLELAVPGISKRFMKVSFREVVAKKYKLGDKIPDIFGKISSKDSVKIVVGNTAMGGPIHYMYIGSMNVSSSYDKKTSTLKFLNGKLIEAVSYAKSHNLYFRFRARREDQRFDPEAKESDGTPKIYGKSPSRGDSAGRIVVTDKISSSGLIVRL